ncbi:MAG: hypothetical protein MK293_02770 [Pedosphaera sp.]|nr:hypothetical protein [Pedosphaera sp.]
MTLSTKLWRCALLDAKTYAEVADDQGATRMAGWIALWAAASCGVGLFRFNIFGVLECILFAGVCLVVTTYIAFAQSPDQGVTHVAGKAPSSTASPGSRACVTTLWLFYG